MRKILHHITDKQFLALKKLTIESGLSVAEHLRRAIDVYLAEQERSKNEKTNV
jgi:hypothetical protein